MHKQQCDNVCRDTLHISDLSLPHLLFQHALIWFTFSDKSGKVRNFKMIHLDIWYISAGSHLWSQYTLGLIDTATIRKESESGKVYSYKIDTGTIQHKWKVCKKFKYRWMDIENTQVA